VLIAKTEAIALRVEPFSKTSHVITWLAPDVGRFATLAKGVQRRRSLLQGQFDIFYTCEVLYYTRAPRGLHILKECASINPRQGFRDDWRKTTTASYLCDLISHLCPPGSGHTGIYRLLERTLDDWEVRVPTPATLVWAELRALEKSGFAPQLDCCTACGDPINSTAPAIFAPDRGGLLCARCVTPTDNRPAMPPDVLAMLRAWQRDATPDMVRRTACQPSQEQSAARLLGAFLTYHLDPLPSSRAIALGLLYEGKKPGKRISL